eukprot:scaffold16392_cov90-Isochrysis_galbana.AAC.1
MASISRYLRALERSRAASSSAAELPPPAGIRPPTPLLGAASPRPPSASRTASTTAPAPS